MDAAGLQRRVCRVAVALEAIVTPVAADEEGQGRDEGGDKVGEEGEVEEGEVEEGEVEEGEVAGKAAHREVVPATDGSHFRGKAPREAVEALQGMIQVGLDLRHPRDSKLVHSG